MKLVSLVVTTLSLLAASQPLTSPKSKSSDVWIGLNLNQCLTNASTIPPPNLSNQQHTAREVIDAYNAWDIDGILAYRSPNCKHRVLPASMNRAAKSNDEYRAYLRTIMPLYSKFTVEVKEEIHDTEMHTCIIHASSTAETKIGLYANEYVLILTFTEDGRKVTKFDEFVDSAYSQQFVAALAKKEPAQ
ncbi:SnoaL-2 domain-containing protein [Pyrenophora tritici-repentis]|nr:SnoaL-2 domain-containing protein [Pyrenophora tritici-repentis]